MTVLDTDVKEELQKYVCQGLKRDEILNFMVRDFGDYAWSMRTLDGRMRHFDIYYTNTDVTVEEDKSAVRKELHGPGKCLGYQAMHSKIRQEYPTRIGRWYLDYLHEERTITSHIRIDRGSETGIMVKMHSSSIQW